MKVVKIVQKGVHQRIVPMMPLNVMCVLKVVTKHHQVRQRACRAYQAITKTKLDKQSAKNVQ